MDGTENLNVKKENTESALHIACIVQDKVLIRKLISEGWDLKAKDSNGYTPADLYIGDLKEKFDLYEYMKEVEEIPKEIRVKDATDHVTLLKIAEALGYTLTTLQSYDDDSLKIVKLSKPGAPDGGDYIIEVLITPGTDLESMIIYHDSIADTYMQLTDIEGLSPKTLIEQYFITKLDIK